MTQPNKFEDLNDRFTSLGTEMTQLNKFRDRWHTLLLDKTWKVSKIQNTLRFTPAEGVCSNKWSVA